MHNACGSIRSDISNWSGEPRQVACMYASKALQLIDEH